ncbi:gamma carbonic anhydrase family protein [Sphingobium sp. TB-6]|nr:gamma carbonic anhydrase family protein [Sphingobium sp. TB-6]
MRMDRINIVPFRGKTPRIDPTAWIAPGCHIIGDVEIGPDASIWYNCVLRGDSNCIRVGARSNIQDGSVIHCDAADGANPGYPTDIGEDVLVGHMAMVHGSTLMSGSFVGIGAIVMDGSVIEPGGMLAAGAMLTPSKRIGSNELWVGRPAKLLREMSQAELIRNQSGVHHYAQLAREFRLAAS